ncbi:GTP-binding protein [Pyrus ussuriensis x Pyrus communis]|uniref:GTP-binding protein n=1 Tax=Pyrus ussuriensis x Pyrus communis TaxID=2448454 RepID=A0A5N5FV64_9ROSA|nr:GTP-binding protein [Pyrus ussuriensis x Pyrus communis]
MELQIFGSCRKDERENIELKGRQRRVSADLDGGERRYQRGALQYLLQVKWMRSTEMDGFQVKTLFFWFLLLDMERETAN